MKIEFNTQEAGADEAKGIVALLVSLYGSTVVPTDIRYTAKAADVLVQSGADRPVWATGDVDASVEYVDEGHIDAAAAFSSIPGTVEDAAAAFANAPTPVREGERDAAGILWDERIHASTKTKTANGQWTRRRNTPDATYDAVMAELRGAPRVPPAPAPVTAPPPPTTAPAPSPAPAVAAASSSAPVGEMTFVNVMKEITKAQGAGKIKPEDVAAILTSIGAPTASVTSLMKDPSLIPAFYALFSEHVA